MNCGLGSAFVTRLATLYFVFVADADFVGLCSFVKEMILDVYMFDSGVESWVFRQFDCHIVVA